MRCLTARIWITRRLHEALPYKDAVRLERHLASCPACRAELEGDTAFEAGLRQRLANGAISSSPVSIAPERLIRRLRQAREGERKARRVLPWPMGPVAAAGLVALVAVVLWPAERPRLSDTRSGQGASSRQNTQTAQLQPERAPGSSRRNPARPTDSPLPLVSPPRIARAGGFPQVQRFPSPRLAMVPSPAPQPPRPAPVLSDEQYLDGRDPKLLSQWMVGNAADPQILAWAQRYLPPMKDDFVRFPLPQIASADPRKLAVGEAVKNYQQEAKVVDPRLFRKVTLRLKAVPLEELCSQLTKQTGASIQASRVVRDEKVTVFVEDLPARDVMRAVTRLFGYFFSRAGEPKAYHYELLQDLRSQLTEEEMRNRDVHEALIALDEEMSWFRPYLDQNVDQLIQRVERNRDGKDPEVSRLYRFVKGGGWGAAQLYFRLSPAERNALMSGQFLRYGSSAQDGEHQLPGEWRAGVLKASGLVRYPTGVIIEPYDRNKPATPVHELPNMEPEVVLRMDRSEAGEISLHVGTYVYEKENGETKGAGGSLWEMAKGRSPSSKDPENAKANAALKNLPLFQTTIDFQPQPSCPYLHADEERKRKGDLDPNQLVWEPELKEPHVNSADIWEEIHLRTHLPIVVDAYTRIYPVSRFSYKKSTTFDVLCRAGDQMGVRWKKDGDFLLGRSISYFWDKLKEVPERLLRHWQEDRDRLGALPMVDLLEMAALSDQQLGSRMVGLGITHCWGLDEWGIVGGGPFIAGLPNAEEMRKRARALAVLNPVQLHESGGEAGLSLDALTPAQREVAARELHWQQTGQQPAARLQVVYIPGGSYVWQPLITRERYEAEAKRWPRVFASTQEEALARARKVDPGTTPNTIHRTRGELDLVFIQANGDRWGTGGPRVLAPLE